MISFPAHSRVRFAFNNLSSGYEWSTFACLNLLTSRYILWDLGWHYPFHLLTLQLLSLVSWTLIKTWPVIATLTNPAPAHSVPVSSGLIKLWIRTGFDGVCMAGSLLLWTQAILHFSSTPILAMLGSITFLPAATRRALHALSLARMMALVRPALFAASMAGLILFEYRITVNGLIFGILPTLGFGLRQTILQVWMSGQGTANPATPITGVLIICLASSALCALVVEDFHSALSLFPRLAWSTVVTFFTNFATAALAVKRGGHIFAYVSDESASWIGLQRPTIIWPLLCSVGGTLLASGRGGLTIVHPAQIMFFLLASFSLVAVDFVPTIRSLLGSARQPRKLATSLISLLPLEDHTDTSEHELVSSADQHTSDGNADSTGRLDRSQAARASASRNQVALVPFVLVLFGISIFLALFPSPTAPRAIPQLDLTYKPAIPLDIVISMHSEPLATLTSTLSLLLTIPTIDILRPRLIIYTKNYKADLSAIAAAVPPSLSPASITLKTNIGRESETYLHHILSHWNTLANHTIFMQASPHNPRELAPRITNFFGADTGFLPLADIGSCPCGPTCADRHWRDDSGVVRDVHLRASGRGVCDDNGGRGRDDILLSYKGQFIASAARIRGSPGGKAAYEELYDLFGDEGSWVHREPYLKGRAEDLSRPVFGYTAERLWASLLQCGDGEVVRNCPTLVSGWRKGGNRGDCQCFDHV